MKKIFSIFLCAIIIFSFATPLAAADSNYYDNGTNGTIINDLENRIAELEAQIAALLLMLSAAPFVDHSAIHQQRQEAVQLERYMFQIKYYTVCLTISHNDLLTRQRDLTARQLELENVRLELGFTTQRNVDDLTAMLNGLNRQIELNNETIQIQRRHIETRRGRHGYEFIGNFTIPSRLSSNVRSADELRTNLVRNNTALAVLESHIRQAFQNNMSWNEIQLMEEQRDLLVRQLEVAAINSWSAYLNARAQHNSAVENRPLLEARLSLIDEMFILGEISEVEKMELRFNVYAELHAADQTAIALAISIAELDFMMRGIVGG